MKPTVNWRTALVLLLLPLQSVFFLDTSAQRASAQEAPEPPNYRETVREALAEYHAKNFNEARALFGEAHQLYPNARTLRGLGMTSFELRNYVESINHLQAALNSQAKPLEGGLRNETERLLRRAERFVGKLFLTIAPAGASVNVDGSAVAFKEGEPLVLEVGDHTLEFRADGYLPETRPITIKGRDVETWSVLLNRVPEPEPPPAPTPLEVAQSTVADEPQTPEPLREEPTPAQRRPLYKNPWLWTGVSAVVLGGAAVGIALALRDPKVAPIDVGNNTPPGGVISALEGRP